ncbi:MAG: methylmalonyl-CoA epimerase [Deltaproteobacteria bacterium]|nr:methylmalonyl-CoA epimerase [Deltaproteobacteria bacterium]|tara:strand:+ start:5770 stop:6186 length:417 start_codon:yes stop_codon:yes gene_type:complete
MVKKVDHIAIAVKDIEQATTFYKQLGLDVSAVEEVPDQKVRVAFIPIGETHIELVEPMSKDSPISAFLEKRGEGLHHICLETDQIDHTVEHLQEQGVRMIDKSPRTGSRQTRIAFVHPKANAGVLTELVEHPDDKQSH